MRLKRLEWFQGILASVLFWSLVTSSLVTLCGCEALQKKFVRKRKTPLARPTPIIHFQDYTRAITPLDRYRKHYVMFDYWNAELLETLGDRDFSLKRLRKDSAEALQELRVLQGLLQEDLAAEVDPLIEERASLDRQIHERLLMPSDAGAIRQRLEVQSRQIHRVLSWREVEDRLKIITDATSD
ncbi:MAG TPA: hypothetical protein DDX89_08295 [Candidatus Omnitrophica bacterium]|nr:MAG: hypothetical protein A2Z92_01805 [Omnitrophica WOR_2 bacterium GWA2_63_20]OGX17261.1 MAG: hypothetical protein A2105_06895 [Omnitrophica WOR_2 bacterium GWF2_63_9]OGX31314.1 MAG: hypothetical protein A3E56_00180 [Omnitrophica WOR_2 bacterium RIFCSPHIGHO2_12_FULL_64_13]OGX36961.1 MAG: hypothetical protein A3B73_01485 [Omnitrophica WOR_2 bacterium RIFCSPHIGHO2_02_FULL_63_39]OGX46432.1 MAG: hypothetical protein A3I71_03060 [Omnitrophica WOR_2 bacterium RIFCSPLOWO2_02_FULL_63_16]OGX49815.1